MTRRSTTVGSPYSKGLPPAGELPLLPGKNDMRNMRPMIAAVFCLARPCLATPELTMDVLSFNEQGSMVTLPATSLAALSETTLEI